MIYVFTEQYSGCYVENGLEEATVNARRAGWETPVGLQ